jgi:hypothetical protein
MLPSGHFAKTFIFISQKHCYLDRKIHCVLCFACLFCFCFYSFFIVFFILPSKKSCILSAQQKNHVFPPPIKNKYCIPFAHLKQALYSLRPTKTNTVSPLPYKKILYPQVLSIFILFFHVNSFYKFIKTS